MHPSTAPSQHADPGLHGSASHATRGHGDGVLWDYLGFPGQLHVASYLTAEYAAVYRLVVDVMLDHQPQYLTGIPHDELHALVVSRLRTQLASDPDTLTAALEQLNLTERLRRLYDWGTISSWEDKVRSDEDFTRHRGRYQLTEAGARLHREIRKLDIAQSASIAAALAPPIIAENLHRMRTHLHTDPNAVAAAWSTITPTIANMADAAATWQAKLAAALSGTPEPDKIADLGDTLNGYIAMWGSGIDTYSTVIADDARHLLTAPDADLRRIALHIAGATADDETIAAVAAEILEVLDRALAWFDGPTSQATALRRQMRDTIVPLVRNKRALAAVAGHISRRTELLNLAERLDQAPDEETAWAVWTTYTGLFSARHLGLRAPHPGTGAEATSFWDAPPTPIEAKLRRQGTRAARGRPARISDLTSGKEAARRAAAATAATEARTRADLLSRSGRPLSSWSTSTEPLTAPVADHLAEFLMSIDSALADARRHRAHEAAPVGNPAPLSVTTTSADGLWDLTAEIPADATTSNAGASTSTGNTIVHLPTGRLVYPDITLSISPAVTDRGSGRATSGARR